MATPKITHADWVERRRRVDAAIHSVEMDGAQVSPPVRADAADYITGLISADELVDRTRARYGIG